MKVKAKVIIKTKSVLRRSAAYNGSWGPEPVLLFSLVFYKSKFTRKQLSTVLARVNVSTVIREKRDS